MNIRVLSPMHFESPRRRQRAWLLWLSALFLLLKASVGVKGNLSWRRQVTAPFGIGIRSALTQIRTPQKSPLLSPEPAHASTIPAAKRPSFSSSNDEGLFEEAQHAYSQPTSSSQQSFAAVKTRKWVPAGNTPELSISQPLDKVEQCSFATTQNQPDQKKVALKQDSSSSSTTSAATRGGSSALAYRPLMFWENMVAGAVSRSVAQTVMHPANTMKTILQSNVDSTLRNLANPKNFYMLTRGAGANFVLSVPHGAVNFAVLEMVRNRMDKIVQNTPYLSKSADRIGPGLDFISSAISTICCSIVSTPQMMITDNIMAGNYKNLPSAVKGLASERGLAGFYAGWWPGLAGKIPSYAITWTFFQQLKTAHHKMTKRPAKDFENAIMGCIASGTTVCIMIPMDTIKTRLVTQATSAGSIPYKGITDCAVRIFREEGIGVFYRGLPPRLVSVVPMIGIQFGVYEFMKRVMVTRGEEASRKKEGVEGALYGRREALEEAAMEVAADDEQPFPAPHFKKKYDRNTIIPRMKKNGLKKSGGKKEMHRNRNK